eukprot:TRINITY_DN35451_c0_g1_i1.p3 TRINITY_DN35451_c0_g1~~TRINITY_DN35451_c0_g1_i1.p3  ORF type:complete len:101 (-),score=23.72 TRINITY_DN35451_c0_g1_i1:765-1067(-)
MIFPKYPTTWCLFFGGERAVVIKPEAEIKKIKENICNGRKKKTKDLANMPRELPFATTRVEKKGKQEEEEEKSKILDEKSHRRQRSETGEVRNKDALITT